MSLEVTGNVQNRFMQVAVLLYLLDPVRGEPTQHGLDIDHNGVNRQRDHLLKRKFLDAFALVCATNKDGDTVSAASLEEGLPEGTVIRLASNNGVKDSTLSGLRDLVSILTSVANRGELWLAACSLDTATIVTASAPSEVEAQVISKIVALDFPRIRHYLKDLRDMYPKLKKSIKQLDSERTAGPAFEDYSNWVEEAASIQDLPPNPSAQRVIGLIRWALEARRAHLACLSAAISPGGQRLPTWVYAILKLARYAIASMALLQLPVEAPHLFNPMLIEPVNAPRKTQFTVSEDHIPLTNVLRRLVGGREADYVSRLGRIWCIADSESHFRSMCSLTLPVHAEMQIINFYDHHQERRPALRFIGVSKKSCFLCHRFLSSHPHSFGVSSCHQKLYLAWRPPPTTSSGVYKQYKAIITELSKVMEAAAKQELQSRLGSRRPVPLDSSVGISSTGLTDSPARPGLSQQDSKPESLPSKAGSGRSHSETALATSQIIEVIDLTSIDDERTHESPPADIISHKAEVADMVFHILCNDGSDRQDIITLGDICDMQSGSPSWFELVKILRGEHSVGFLEGSECLMVNDRIRLVNQRQLLACIQYLRNAGVWNSVASVDAL